jgi:hypothetical protein
LDKNRVLSKQFSGKFVIFIISVWNTMVGSNLLSIPWAFSESGLVVGIGKEGVFIV